MSGPSVGLWLPCRRGALDAVRLLEDVCDLEAVSPDGEFDLTVRDPAAIGLPGLPGEFSCPYSLLPEALDAAEHAGFPGLDEPPTTEVALVSYTDAPESHLVLGHLALFLAERLDALVAFDALLTPGARTTPLPESRALAASLPGRVLEMPYEIVDGRHGYIHVADHTFLAAWLAHPQFHMLK